MGQSSRQPLAVAADNQRDPRVPTRLVRLEGNTPRRDEAETIVRTAFADRYQARIRELPSCLMTLRTACGALAAVASLRFASDSPLFLEQYLDGPVESYLSAEARSRRDTIVEIGSLAAPQPGQVRYLMIALVTYLHRAGYRWVVCTAIHSLRNTLSRMGFTPIVLGSADPSRLGSAATDWGRYYEERPQVIAGHLGEAAAILEARCAGSDSPVHPLWRSACNLGLRDRIAVSFAAPPLPGAGLSSEISA